MKKSQIEYLKEKFSTPIKKPRSLEKIVGALSLLAHPLYECFDTTVRMAFFYNKILGWGLGKTYALTFSSVGLTLLKEGLCMVPGYEKIMGKPVNYVARHAVSENLLPILLWLSCLVTGTKFSMNMALFLGFAEAPLDLLKITIVLFLGVFCFGKERLVSYAMARESLTHFGYDANSSIFSMLDTIPLINGKIPFTDLVKIIENNQAILEGGLHGVAVYEAANKMGFKGILLGILALVGASGEKLARRHDEEIIKLQRLLPEAKKKLNDYEKEAISPTADWKAVVLRKVGSVYNAITCVTTSCINLVGNCASLLVDEVNFVNPLVYIWPKHIHALIKVMGNSALGLVVADILIQKGLTLPDGTEIQANIHPLGWQVGLGILGGLAGIAQWNARNFKLQHKLNERYARLDAEKSVSTCDQITSRWVSATLDTFLPNEDVFNSWSETGHVLWMSKNSIPSIQEMKKEKAVSKFTKMFMENKLNNIREEEMSEIYQSYLEICQSYPEFFLKMHFMQQSGKFNVEEAQKIIEETHFQMELASKRRCVR